MRRLAYAFVGLLSVAVLVACGDAGDHFGEFRQQPPGPTNVKSVTLAMPVIPGPNTASGKFQLTVVAYADGSAIPAGTMLTYPIKISTNYPGYVQFNSPTGPQGQKYNALSLIAAPPTLTVYYKRPSGNLCSGNVPGVYITALNHTANPVTTNLNLTPCATPTPSTSASPSTKPSGSPSPTPKPSATPTTTPTPAAKKIVLSMPATPNPVSPGTFTLVIQTYGPGGKLLPTGTALPNPIQLTSNSSCSVSFIANGGTSSSATLTTVPGSINIAYSPPSATCVPPNSIVISAFDVDATPQTSSFSILGGTATVGSITLTMISAPNQTSEGVYPFFVDAKDTSGNPIPYGVTLSNPIELSSNASCATGFGTTLNPGSFTGTFRLTSTQTQVYLGFNPAPSCVPPTGNNVIVTGIASGTSSATYTFPY